MKRKRLRSGFTTGSAATAATRAALIYLISGKIPDWVEIHLPEGKTLNIPIHNCAMKGSMAECTVIKDAGDDPDVTNKAIIGSRVSFISIPLSPFKGKDLGGEEAKILIQGGEGVGLVTKPGLEVTVGDWAINPVPRKMISQNIRELIEKTSEHFPKSIRVEIFVPDGENLARKTLNARLGIERGISILGTTGIVHPMSHDAYKASITLAMDVAKAMEQKTLILTTGRRSERFAMSCWQSIREEAFIQIGDYFKFSLDEAAQRRFFDQIDVAVFFAKALKMACGIPQTHASRSTTNLNELSLWTYEITNNRELSNKVRNSNTAREALEWIKKKDMRVIQLVGCKMIESARRFSGNLMEIHGIIFDFDGGILFNSEEEQ
jgi:cobalt-precorrin-5B (C1)-methyltransferase